MQKISQPPDLPERVLVLGLGMSGRSAANFCAERGAHVVAADERSPGELIGLDELHASVRVAAGQHFADFGDFSEFDLLIPSPGVPAERYAAARTSGVEVWGDIELAHLALHIPAIAVTGTNGKSTCVRMIEAMLGAADLRTCAVGNLGRPILSLVGDQVSSGLPQCR